MARRRHEAFRLSIALLSLCVLLAPLATAAPASGTLEVASGIALGGPSTTTGSNPLLIFQDLTDTDSFTAAANTILVEYQEATYLKAQPVGPVAYRRITSEDRSNENFTAASLSLSDPQTDLYLAAYPDQQGQSEYVFSFETLSQAHLRSQGPTKVRSLPVVAGTTEKVRYEFVYDLKRDHLLTDLAQGTISLTGDFSVYFWNVTVSVNGTEGERTYRTGEFKSNDNGVTHDMTYAWVVATLKGTTLTFEATESGVTVYADALTATTTGTVRFDEAEGWFDWGGESYSAEGEDLSLQGELTLELEPTRSSSRSPTIPGTEESPRVRVNLDGDLLGASIQGRMLSPPAGVSAPEAVVLVGAGALVGRFLWLFYWRLHPNEVLRNRKRARILETARVRPGLTPAELAREADVPSTTARHHLRVLARFGFVVLAPDPEDRRVRRVFALESEGVAAAPSPQERRLHAALGREAGLRVAKALLGTRPAEDEAPGHGEPRLVLPLGEIAQAAGLPKSTALRHLRRLARAGAVEVKGEHPRDRRYGLTKWGRECLLLRRTEPSAQIGPRPPALSRRPSPPDTSEQ